MKTMKRLLLFAMTFAMWMPALIGQTVTQNSIIDGFVQGSSPSLNSSLLYVRDQNNFEASFHRESYLVFEMNESVDVTSALLKLTFRSTSNTGNTGIDIEIAEGDLVSSIVDDENDDDKSQIRAGGAFTTVEENLDLTGSSVNEVLEVDLADEINAYVLAGDVSAFTIRLVQVQTSSSGDALNVQFYSTATSGKEPTLDILSTCPPGAVSVDLGEGQTVTTGTEVVLDAGSFSSYSWFNNDSELTGQNGQTLAVDDDNADFITGANVIRVEVTDGNGCTGSDEVTINFSGVDCSSVDIDPDLGSGQTITAPETVTLDAGAGLETYSWTNNGGEEIAISQTLMVDPGDDAFVLGDNMITVNVSNSDGCTGTSTVTIHIDPDCSSIAGPDFGNDLVLFNSQSTQLDAGTWETYEWAINGSVLEGVTGDILPVSLESEYFSEGTNSVSVSVSDESGCDATGEIIITYSGMPTPPAGGTYPESNGYVYKNNGNGTFHTEQVYLRGSTVFQRTGFLVFPLNQPEVVPSATLKIVLSSFRDDLANPITVDVHGGEGDLFTSLEAEEDPFVAAPASEALALVGSFSVSDLDVIGAEIEIDITTFLNDLIENSSEDYFTIRLNSSTSNALATFYSNETSDVGNWPILEIGSTPSTVSQAPSIDGFLQNGNDFSKSDIYVRGQGSTDASFHREGYVVLDQNEVVAVDEAILELTAKVDAIAATEGVAQFDIEIAEGDLISGILDDGTPDWTQRPADENFTSIGTIDVNGIVSGDLVSVDITDEVNAFISGGTVESYTLRLIDLSANQTLIRFFTSLDENENNRPKLVISSSCPIELIEIDTIVCETSLPLVFEAENDEDDVTVTENGTYDVLFTNACGGQKIRRYNVDIIGSGSSTENVTICSGEEFLGETEGGTFTVTKTSDDDECTESITYNLSIEDLPIPNLGEDQEIGEDESVTLDAGSFDTYLWSTGETTQAINVTLESENFAFGANTISVTVTSASGCQGTDEIVVTIEEQAIEAVKANQIRDDKDGFFDLGTRVEVKYDLYGDLNTPEGDGPFFNRELFVGFDVSELDGLEISAVHVQMYCYDIDEVNVGTRPDLSHDTPVDAGVALGIFDDSQSVTWDNRPMEIDYPNKDQVLIKEEDLPGFYQWDVSDFVIDDVLGANETEFSVRFTATLDTASTLVKFRSLASGIESQRPKLLYEISDGTVLATNELGSGLVVYPNPTQGELYVKSDEKLIAFEVIDMEGRVLMQSKFDGAYQVPLQSLNKGIYILRLHSEKGIKHSRIRKL